MAEPTDTRRKGLSFDPTINAGHVLTFVSLLAALVLGWNALDKRVVVLEEAKSYQRERDNAQDAVITDKLTAIKESIADVKRGVEDLRQQRQGSR